MVESFAKVVVGILDVVKGQLKLVRVFRVLISKTLYRLIALNQLHCLLPPLLELGVSVDRLEGGHALV